MCQNTCPYPLPDKPFRPYPLAYTAAKEVKSELLCKMRNRMEGKNPKESYATQESTFGDFVTTPSDSKEMESSSLFCAVMSLIIP